MEAGFLKDRKSKQGFDINTKILESAWQTCFALLGGDTQRIDDIVLNAIDGCLTYQEKRTYFDLKSRDTRNKIIFDYPMLLQYLVFGVCKRFEIDQERDHLAGKRVLNEQTMTVRYIKHLIYISIPHKSFHVAVGVCRVLHNYSYAETSRIYEIGLAQSEDPNKSDVQYRDWKKIIMDSLSTRFDGFINTCEGARGEKRFKTRNKTQELVRFVQKYLDIFIPWESACTIPRSFGKKQFDIPALRFFGVDAIKGTHPDEEHPVEKNRMHTILHSHCFLRLVDAFGLDHPEDRLEIPNFFLNKKDNIDSEPPIDLNNLPPAPPEYFTNVLNGILKQRSRRKRFYATTLYVFVDGVEQACFDLKMANSLQIDLALDADLIQIFAKENDEYLLLSTLSLKYSQVLQSEDTWHSSCILEGGQKINISLSYLSSLASEMRISVYISYSETNFIKALSLLFQRFGSLIKYRSDFLFQRLILVLAIMVVLVLGITLYLQLSKPELKQSQKENQDRLLHSPATSKEIKSPTAVSPSDSRLMDNRENKQIKSPVANYKDLPSNQRKFEDRTRREVTSEEIASANERGIISNGVSLKEVKTVYIEMSEESPLSQQLHTKLIDTVQASERWTIANTHQSDAHLIISINRIYSSGKSRISITAKLVNARGDLLWPLKLPGRRSNYIGSIEAVVSSLVRDILTDIDRLDDKR
ncbi:MAG: hypothetical protein AB1489_30170 [Acidobacteriota bacterium]